MIQITEEQREINKQKRLKDQEYARNHLKTTYSDENFWRNEASKYGLKLPGWWYPASETKYVRRACKKLGVNIDDFIASTGCKNLQELAKINNKWSVLGLVGLVIEWKTSYNV